LLDQETKTEYLELVRAFPLMSIRDDEQLHEALEVVKRFIRKPQLSAAEETYVSALADLIETYEDAHVNIPPLRGVDALRYLMEANELTQADLVPEFGTASVVSEVLSGKRRLALTHIKRLAARFGLPADVFLDGSPSPPRRRS
jgi:HTH-type transcriptional regulator/antitoxin HigA